MGSACLVAWNAFGREQSAPATVELAMRSTRLLRNGWTVLPARKDYPTGVNKVWGNSTGFFPVPRVSSADDADYYVVVVDVQRSSVGRKLAHLWVFPGCDKNARIAHHYLVNNVISFANSVVRNQAVFDLGRSLRRHAQSVARIATGSRLVDTMEDPGAYAVSLKLRLTGNALDAVEQGLMNAQSFLQAREDGLLTVARAVERMNEIATLVQDPIVLTADVDANILELNALR